MSIPTLRAHQVHTLEDRVRILKDLVWKGDQVANPKGPPTGSLRDPQMRQYGLLLTKNCPPRADMCELQAIFDTIAGWRGQRAQVRYTGDIAGKDTYQSALRTLQFGGGDCLPLSTLFLRSDYQLVALADLKPGDQVMADSQWRPVQDVWVTGRKPILAIKCSNGAVFRSSPEHRAFLRDGKEVRTEDLKVGQQLTMPEGAFPTTPAQHETWTGIADTDFAWLKGVYLADGWWDKSRVCVSGLDGKAKEAQKKRVQAIMESAGIDTRWHEKYIAINDRALADNFSTLGHHAPVKHLTSLNFSKEQVDAVIDGLRADGGTSIRGTFVHSTTSFQLALQLRVLYRMRGQSVHIVRVDDHGGLGSNPIYRVTVRKPAAEWQGTPRNFSPRIVSITEEPRELCGDLTVEGGRVWLPESDIIVHNCDDQAVLNAVMAMEKIGRAHV